MQVQVLMICSTSSSSPTTNLRTHPTQGSIASRSHPFRMLTQHTQCEGPRMDRKTLLHQPRIAKRQAQAERGTGCRLVLNADTSTHQVQPGACISPAPSPSLRNCGYPRCPVAGRVERAVPVLLSGIPTPESSTVNTYRLIRHALGETSRVPRTRTCPRSVNLTAFDTRFIKICLSRNPSTQAQGAVPEITTLQEQQGFCQPPFPKTLALHR
jgi:hypothetical protein